jgi:hypothetical protein
LLCIGLAVFLESPNGTVVELFSATFNREGDLAVTLDGAAGASITTVPCGGSITGTFQSEGSLTPASCTDCYALFPGTGVGGTAGVTVSQLPVAAQCGSVVDNLNLTVDITHSFLANLHIYLRSPAGTVVKVFDQQCGDNDNLDVNFDDEAMGELNCANRLRFNSF